MKSPKSRKKARPKKLTIQDIVRSLKKMTPEEERQELELLEEWEAIDALNDLDERDVIEGTRIAYQLCRRRSRRKSNR